jgi:hypothetical protein
MARKAKNPSKYTRTGTFVEKALLEMLVAFSASMVFGKWLPLLLTRHR